MRKFALTVLAATVGGLLGYAYARLSLPPEVQKNQALLAMHVSAGAAFAVLGVRLAQILGMVLRETMIRRRSRRDL
jgi:hypothetical protein